MPVPAVSVSKAFEPASYGKSEEAASGEPTPAETAVIAPSGIAPGSASATGLPAARIPLTSD